MRIHLPLTCIFAVSLSAAAMAAVPASNARIVLPGNVSPTNYDIAIIPDAAHLSLTGTVKIDIDVSAATREVELNAADLAFQQVGLSGRAETPKVTFDAGQQTAKISFAAPISPGHYVLTINYSGKIYQQASGLFALDYGDDKNKRRALFTQFENSDARRFVPCWDEPNKKATYTLAATVPASDMPISNMPIASTEQLKGGLKRVHFAPSPKMSSYLLFFGSGDFERVTRKVGNVEIGIVMKRGETAKAAYSLDAAAHLLPFYEDYFGVKYPLPKLDLIAGPGTSQFFGAMENWGAIFYFESALLIDPKTSTEREHRGIYSVVAHEMAHQWFGDLVTMDWWDDLWLNEGYATWMAFKATDHFHPEWRVMLDAIGSKDGAMARDSRAGTHPVIQPILDVLQANQAFDAITYRKGAAVIHMIEQYVGPEAFRASVRKYIAGHAYGNTVTDDLWRELDKVSPRKVTQLAHEFTLQEGVPLIHVATSTSGVRLTQGRFGLDEASKAPQSWHVPVIARALNAKTLWRGAVSRESPADVPASPDAGILLNVGQSGYYRVQYEPGLFARLAGQFRALDATDQLGLLLDTRMLGYAGDAPLSNLLGLAQSAKPDMDAHVLSTIAERLSAIDFFYNDLPEQKSFRAFGRQVLQPLFAQISWNPKAGESENAPILRAALIDDLSQFDDPAIIAEARARFADFLKNQDSLAADKRQQVLQTVALHADAKTWDAIHGLAKASKDTVLRERYYDLLASTHDVNLAKQALALTLTNEIELTTRPGIIGIVSGRFSELAFDFALAHHDLLMNWLEPTSRDQFVTQLAASSLNATMIPKLRAYAAAHIPASARRSAVVAESNIAFSVQVRTKRLPEVDRWLKARGY